MLARAVDTVIADKGENFDGNPESIALLIKRRKPPERAGGLPEKDGPEGRYIMPFSFQYRMAPGWKVKRLVPLSALLGPMSLPMGW